MPPGKLYQALRLRREKGWLACLSARALRVDDALLDYYNWRLGAAWPSYETLCRDTGLSRSAVREAICELKFYGRWRIAQERPPQSRTARGAGGNTCHTLDSTRYSRFMSWAVGASGPSGGRRITHS